MGIFLSLGAEEIAKLRQRVMRRMNAMVAEGKVPYKAPYGYKNHEGGVIPHDDERPILEKLFALRTEGYSYIQIAEYLNDRGIRTRTGAKWKTSTVSKIVQNEFYLGIVRFAGQVGEGIFERIVSRDLWDKANEKKRTLIGYKKHSFALKGIVVSAKTGKSLKASKIKGKYHYYHDDTHGISISEKAIFSKLESVVERWRIPDDLVPEMERSVREHILRENGSIIEERKRVEKQLSTIRERKSRLLALSLDGAIDSEDYAEAKRTLIFSEQKLVEELQCLIGMDAAIEEEFREMVKLLKDLSIAYKTGDDHLRGVILKEALVKLEVDEKKRLQVHEKEPFAWLSASTIPLGKATGNRTPVYRMKTCCPDH